MGMGEIGERAGRIARHPLTQLAATIGVALVDTAISKHRERTHHSVELGPTADVIDTAAGAPFADTDTWAAVHRIHHSTPDTNLHPLVEYADLVEWLAQNPERARGYDTPEVVFGMDPVLREMRHKDAVRIGNMGRDIVAGKYMPTDDYSDDDIRRILYGQQPRYFYESKAGNGTKATPLGDHVSLYDIRYLLRDPHSPALHPDGIMGILRHNRALYNDVDALLRGNPGLRQEDLRESRRREEFISRHKGIIRVGFVLGSAALRVVARRPKTARGIAVEAAKGAAISGAATAALIAGGNIVNGLGHGGDADTTTRRFWRNLGTGKVEPRANGTFYTNNPWLSPATLGEVGGQYEHHEDPSLIAYTHETGIKRWLVDPFGCAVEALVKRHILLRPGPGFPGQERRPDMPSEAVLEIEALRRIAIAELSSHGKTS